MAAGLDARHHTAALVAAIRSPYPGVDALAPTADDAADSTAHPWRHVDALAPDEGVLAIHHPGFVRVAAGTVPHRP